MEVAVEGLVATFKAREAPELMLHAAAMLGSVGLLMAGAAGSVIIGFHTKLENGVTPLAKHHGVPFYVAAPASTSAATRAAMATLASMKTILGSSPSRWYAPISLAIQIGAMVVTGETYAIRIVCG